MASGAYPTIIDTRTGDVIQIKGFFPVVDDFVKHLNDQEVGLIDQLSGSAKPRYLVGTHQSFNVDMTLGKGDGDIADLKKAAQAFIAGNPRIIFERAVDSFNGRLSGALTMVRRRGQWEIGLVARSTSTDTTIRMLADRSGLSVGQIETFLQDWVEEEFGKEVADKVFAPIQARKAQKAAAAEGSEEDDEEEDDEEDEDEL